MYLKFIIDMVCIFVIVCGISVFLFYLFPILEVSGNSMHPTLKDGQFLLARRVSRTEKLHVGEIYVINSPSGKIAVKRLDHCLADKNLYFFTGDNAEASYDSRSYGYLDREDILAKVIIGGK